jgi:penicillin G amidase
VTSPLRTILATAVLAGGLWIGARPVAPAPALGPLLDPAHGVWALARAGETRGALRDAIPGLRGPVQVIFDDRAVPHIFATTIDDAYRALGYVVARDRLAQLHVQTLAASGRVTELAGARALELDREMRRLGLPRAAERNLASAPAASATRRAVEAYADGVNAYIGSMDAGALPIEFRLTGTSPERWQPINSMHLFSRMGWTLAYITPERERTMAASRVGRVAAAALFPETEPVVEPIQPNGSGTPRAEPARLPAPGPPDTSLVISSALLRDRPDEPRHFASNNWAVAPRRTRNGHALLAGDPHLDLTLPSIWYEAHLVVPGQLDVHGVTLPGAPAIVIGFNRDIAWTFTNTSADVLDLWAETVDDVALPTRYRVDRQWRTLERRIEVYRGKMGETVATDTVLYSHRGPLRREGGRWLSMRWTVLEPTDALRAFHGAATARTVDEFQEVMASHFAAPAQNMLVADRSGHIAIRSTGCFPVRAGTGSGLEIRDGSTSASDWKGCLPVARWPQARDPEQGFLASANQQPIDPRATRDYWGGDYDPWRALRINRLLRADSSVTPETMMQWQTDPGSERAATFAPHFVRAGRGSPRAGAREAAQLLSQWDLRYTRDTERAVLFEAAMQELLRRTWDELIADRGDGRRVATPSLAVLATLLADSTSVWWDDSRTAVKEDRDALLAVSLESALANVRREHGEPSTGRWRWGQVRHANIRHILQLPAFSAMEIPVQGGPSTLSPSSGRGTHGASWRMVVELGPELRAWGTYPGGQSGHPSSDRYSDRLALWREGRLEPIWSPKTLRDVDRSRTTATLVLEPQTPR